MQAGAKIKFNHLASRSAQHTRVLGRHSVAAWQGLLVELKHEVGAAIDVGNHRAGHAKAAVCVGGDQQPSGRRQAHAGQTRLVAIDTAVAVLVVESPANNIGAVKERIGNHAHSRARWSRSVLARAVFPRPRSIDVLALGNTTADNKQQGQYARLPRDNFDVVPKQGVAVDTRWVEQPPVQRSRVSNVLEAGWHMILDAHQHQRANEGIAQGDCVGHELTTYYIGQRRGLGHRHGGGEVGVYRDIVLK